jgi:DNA replication protein DnaC
MKMDKEIAHQTIKLYAKELKLPSFNNYETVINRLDNDEGYADFLVKMMKNEKDSRDEKGRKNRIRKAKFPYIKTFDELELDRFENVDPAKIRELASCDFIDRKENVVLIGNPRTGKTHLSIAIGIKACQKGYKVRFITAHDLVYQMIEAKSEKQLTSLTKALMKVDLLIIDELSYLTLDKQQSSLLFKIISDRSERRSTIITSNLAFSEWETIFGDKMLVSAIAGRMMFHSCAINANSSRPYTDDYFGVS